MPTRDEFEQIWHKLDLLDDCIENVRQGIEHIGNFLLNSRETRYHWTQEEFRATQANVPKSKQKKLPKRKSNKA